MEGEISAAAQRRVRWETSRVHVPAGNLALRDSEGQGKGRQMEEIVLCLLRVLAKFGHSVKKA